MTLPVTYYAPSEVTSPRFAYAFAKGCKGTITEDVDDLYPGPVALFGSPSRWPLLRQAQREGRDWYYGDHGYFGRRKYYRITRNAYQHDGTGDATPDRFRYFQRDVQPWRTTGSHVLVCPNTATYFGLHGLSIDDWLIGVRATLATVTDRALRIRWKVTAEPIGTDLRDAWACVVFSSAAAIDALIAGVPVFTLAPFACTARMGLSDLTQIESPFYPDDREPFLWSLANQQWTFQEIYDGVAWRAVGAS